MSLDLLQVGQKAPQFSLLNHEGEKISLNDFENKGIVLWFFPKANTPGWINQGKGFRDEFNKFKDITIIGVSADSTEKQRKFVKKYNFPFLMLCDESKAMIKALSLPISSFLNTEEDNERLENAKKVLKERKNK